MPPSPCADYDRERVNAVEFFGSLGRIGGCDWTVDDLDSCRSHPRWLYRYRDAPPVDERLAIAIAILVDAAIATVGVTQVASATFWASVAVLVGAQALFLGSWLWHVSRRHDARVWRRIHRP
jgi:hypothetical protein